jgi:energy-coupling factor transport system ATP-binding protein
LPISLAIIAHNLSWRYRDVNLLTLQNCELQLYQGDRLGIIGPTASGKTTFCLALLGFIPYRIPGEFSGMLEVLGSKVGPPGLLGNEFKTGLVFQNTDNQFLRSTVRREIAFGMECLSYSKADILERLFFLSNQLKMNHIFDLHPLDLSSGQKRLVNIASVLALDPSLLVLDGALNGLDSVAKEAVIGTFNVWQRRQDFSLIITGHHVHSLAGVSDQIATLSGGQFDQSTPIDQWIINRFEDRNYAALPDIPRFFCHLAAIGIQTDTRPPITEDQATDVLQQLSSKEFSIINKFFTSLSIPNHINFEKHLLSLIQVSSRYKSSVPVLDRINLSIYHGESIAILGPNGSGKSTLARTISGLLHPVEGSVYIDNFKKKIGAQPNHLRCVAYVSQNPNYQLFCSTIQKELALGFVRDDIIDDPFLIEVNYLLDKFGLCEQYDSIPWLLSQGQKYCLVIAAMLLRSPKLLILDEPSSDISPQDFILIAQTIRRLQNATGMAWLLITHDFGLALRWCSRSIILKNTGILYDGSSFDLVERERLLIESHISPPTSLPFIRKLHTIAGIDSLPVIERVLSYE